MEENKKGIRAALAAVSLPGFINKSSRKRPERDPFDDNSITDEKIKIREKVGERFEQKRFGQDLRDTQIHNDIETGVSASRQDAQDIENETLEAAERAVKGSNPKFSNTALDNVRADFIAQEARTVAENPAKVESHVDRLNQQAQAVASLPWKR
jgi:hypothetical protein